MRQNAAGSSSFIPPPPPPDDGRGYQWKCLFLPHGTRLRMHVGEVASYADVVGDAIIYAGHSVSPRGLTLAIAGDGRNAWRDLWIRLPGARAWKRACMLRRDIEGMNDTPPLSPGAALHAAAASMAGALKSALALVELATPQMQQLDRRAAHHRRRSDVLGEACSFD